MNAFNFEKSMSGFKNQVDWVGLRYYRERAHSYYVRNENPEGNSSQLDQGVMIEVLVDGHLGYAATSDLTADGLKQAFQKAKMLSTQSSRYRAAEFSPAQRPASKGKYQSPYAEHVDSLTTEEVFSTLMRASKTLKVSEKIVARHASATILETQIQYLSSNGAEWNQNFNLVTTYFQVTGQSGKESQTRTAGNSTQKGAEAIRDPKLFESCQRIGEQALELLDAENCPTEIMDVILAPDQMHIQIHESIGHPLELDRILGDERNYAGWSFVKPENFGILQYGSKLLNVVFDPQQENQFASYAFDDVGNPATREFLIKDGKLLRGLGSLESQMRLGIPGVANARASSWNRAPIDRMANINVVPGDTSLEAMVASTKKGILLRTNKSWSIDDYRNKFQFGCEYGQLIENGKITRTVKNPNYRGITLKFWNSLKAVGHPDTYEAHGSPNCGKGEPSQIIRVDHAAPYCHFADVEVFGGLA